MEGKQRIYVTLKHDGIPYQSKCCLVVDKKEDIYKVAKDFAKEDAEMQFDGKIEYDIEIYLSI